MTRRVVVIADSLAFHGPGQPELLTHPDLFPNVLARELGAEVDVIGRMGWTARDGWWALTKDPYVYSVLLPRADAVVLCLGCSDSLPASLPAYLRDGIAHIRGERVRRSARGLYHRAHPWIVRATGGRRRVLALPLTLQYLTRSVEALRYLRPERPIIGIVPPAHAARYHAYANRGHDRDMRAHGAWSRRAAVPLVDLDAIVAPHLAAGTLNSDGMHWSWEVHAEVGKAFAAEISQAWADSPR